MFIGHYGIGFMIKRRFSEVPIWVLLLFVQLIDIISFILVLSGVEKAAYINSGNPFLRNNLDLPYSHSLSGALLLCMAYFIEKNNSLKKSGRHFEKTTH